MRNGSKIKKLIPEKEGGKIIEDKIKANAINKRYNPKIEKVIISKRLIHLDISKNSVV